MAKDNVQFVLSVNESRENLISTLKEAGVDISTSATLPAAVSAVSQLIPDEETLEQEGKHLVRFWDIDGTMLKEEYVEDGGTATPPDDPNYDPDYLTFVEWNNDLDNVDWDMDVGPIYDTIDGNMYMILDVNKIYASTIYSFGFSANYSVTVDWGDGTDATTGTSQKHTYSDYGTYVIKITKNTTSNTYISTSSGTYGAQSYIKRIYESTQVYTSGSQFYNYTYNLEIISFYKSRTNLQYGNSAWDACKLKALIFPKTLTTIYSSNGYLSNVKVISMYVKSTAFTQAYFYGGTNGEYCFPNRSLERLIFPKAMTSGVYIYYFHKLKKIILPQNLKTLGIYGMNSLKSISLPSTITSISASAFQYCHDLENLTLNGMITFAGSICNSECYNLKSIIFESTATVTTLNSNSISFCNSLETLILPASLQTISTSCIQYCGKLKKIIIPSTVVSIGNNSFIGCVNLTDVIILCTTVPTLGGTSAFQANTSGTGYTTYYLNPITFWVNDDILEDLKVATNWSTYAQAMKPLSEYEGEY